MVAMSGFGTLPTAGDAMSIQADRLLLIPQPLLFVVKRISTDSRHLQGRSPSFHPIPTRTNRLE
ncbi:MAG: hypothetical protein HC838_17660 [Spirulinaceae cyanobacterium RM2_2_10]|nr:hypothetical protein [Spirulinaceae cyanobacterium RM2_2_10]